MNIKRHFIFNPIGNQSHIPSVNRPSITTGGVVNLAPPVDSNHVINVPIRHTNLSNASLFIPPGPIAPSIQVFKEMVIKDLIALKCPRNQ